VERVYDSPRAWVRSHIRDYVESGGKKGHRWHGFPTLRLTTRGRRSGKLRRTALIYGHDRNRYLLVASSGGSPTHPLWYLNLVEDHKVVLQVGPDVFAGRARTANTRERPRLWRLMNEINPEYEQYQARAAKHGREIPVVIVEPA
jgi:deazaflavin-dependent oxidoreductase (nitroreductase family)